MNLEALSNASFLQRPFVNYYASTFILYELSTIPLNFHWFFDKLDMTGSRGQLYNGIALLFTFFGCRLFWGTWQSLRVYKDLWSAFRHTPAAAALADQNGAPNHDLIMTFAGDRPIPLWLPLTYLASNVLLNALNWHWFGKMIATLRKRFEKPAEEKSAVAVAAKTTGANGTVKVDIDKTEVRRRQPAGLEASEEENEIPPAFKRGPTRNGVLQGWLGPLKG